MSSFTDEIDHAAAFLSFAIMRDSYSNPSAAFLSLLALITRIDSEDRCAFTR
jgi:hypothetical protein